MHVVTRSLRARRRLSWAVCALTITTIGAGLVACGEVATVAEPAHEAVSAMPGATITPDPAQGTGISPATITPTPTVPAPPPGDDGGGGGDDGGGGGTVLTGGAPTRLTFGMHVGQIDGGAWPSVSVGTFRI